MMTVAAVDRLIHHALIIELQAKSYRQQAAQNRQKPPQDPKQKPERSRRS